MRVADFHTYFVGCDEWGFSVWAHNRSCEVIRDFDPLTKAHVPGRDNLQGAVRTRRLSQADGEWGALKGEIEADVRGLYNPAMGENPGVVYVLRDATTGEVFKVGKASAKTAGEMFAYRYGKAAQDFAAAKGVPIDLVVDYAVLTKSAGGKLGRAGAPELTFAYETRLRQAYREEGHRLLWDKTKGQASPEIKGFKGSGEPWDNPQLADYWLKMRTLPPGG